MSKNNKLADAPIEYFAQSRAEMLRCIPKSVKAVLDVGCSQGYFGELIKQQLGNDIDVWGVEINAEMGELAKQRLDHVIIDTIDEALPQVPDKHFDAIIFNDVLEHLVDPYSVLENIQAKLSQSGVVVASIPNVRYFAVLKSLLFGKQWKYQDYGILDITHLRFFTQKSIVDMFTSHGYEIVDIQGINPTGSMKFKIFNILTFGFFDDCQYAQFACVAKLRK